MNKNVYNKIKHYKFRTTALSYLLCVVLLSPSVIYANRPAEATRVWQVNGVKVSVSLKEKPLDDILLAICKQASMKYGFHSSVNLDLKKRYSLDVKNVTLEYALSQLFEGTPYDFRIEKDRVIVVNRSNTTVPDKKTSKIDVKGVVVDDDNLPVVGASVTVVGTRTGTATDVNGAFLISMIPGQTLEVNFVGCVKNQKVINQSSDKLLIKLTKDIIAINEVVVNGIFTRKAESFTGSSSTYKASDLKKVGAQNLLECLKTLEPSFTILESRNFGSDPNRLPDIEIRGKSSVIGLKEKYGTDPNQPLFILDGFETDLKTIVDLNMDRVQSITTLKDAASTAIYGSKAANGVVVIETKRPEKGKFRVTYGGNIFVSMPDLSDYNLMNSSEKLQFEIEAGRYKASNMTDQLFLDSLYNVHKAEVGRGVNTYWMNEPLRVAVTHKHNLYAEGGDENVRYGIGLTYNVTNGVMKSSSNDLVGSNFDIIYRKNKFSLSNAMSFDYYRQQDPTVGFSEYAKANPYYRKTNKAGEVERYLEEYYSANRTPFIAENPMYNANLNSFKENDKVRFVNKINAEYKILPEFVVRGRFAVEKVTSQRDQFTSPSSSMFENERYNKRGSYYKGNGSEFTYDGDLTISYGKLLAEKHQINAVLGGRLRSTNSISESNASVGFPVGDYTTPSFASGYSVGSKPSYSDIISRSNSFYFNGGYTWDNRYLIDANFRLDGASIFGSNKRYTETWAVGLAWNVNNEPLLRNIKWLDRFKIRFSVGNPGNQNFSAYQAFTTYRFNNTMQNPFGASMIIDGFGNPNLAWQKTIDKNFGFDLTLMGNRLNFDFDYYIKDTDPLLAEISVPSSVGVKNIYTNMGSQLGQGYSGTLRYAPIFRPNEGLNWTLSLTFKHQTAEYRNIGNSLDQLNQANMNSSMVRYYDGGSPTSLWAVRSLGINPADGREVFLKKDGTYTFNYDINDQVIVGNSDPKIDGVLGSTFYYKGFSLSLYFRYSLGADVFTQATYEKVENLSMDQIKYNQDARALYDRWRKPGDRAKFKRISLSEQTPMSSRFVLEENYLKAESVSVGYDFNSDALKKFGLQSLRLQASMNDMLRISSIKEERGIEYPFARQFAISMSVTF